jgi:hypothetical protein
LSTQPKSESLQLVNTKHAAGMLGLPEGTLKGWRSREIGPKWVKMGRDVRYDVAELLDFVRRSTHVPSVRASEERRGTV